MKVGIIGYRGFVGSAFYEAFSSDKKYAVEGIDRGNLQSLSGTRFDLLINCNGNSSKRLAQQEPEKDYEMNVAQTAKFLQQFPCEYYVHLSTIDVYYDKASKEATGEGVRIDPQKLSNYGRSKYFGEQEAKKAPHWLIVRLGGMVGKNMKKGPAFDIIELHRLFISEKSCYQFLQTQFVASAVKRLVEMGKWGEIYNLVGEGCMPLSQFASEAGVKLAQAGKEVQVFKVSSEKIAKLFPIPSSAQSVKEFVASLPPATPKSAGL